MTLRCSSVLVSPGVNRSDPRTTAWSGSSQARIAPSAVSCRNRTEVITKRPDDPYSGWPDTWMSGSTSRAGPGPSEYSGSQTVPERTNATTSAKTSPILMRRRAAGIGSPCYGHGIRPKGNRTAYAFVGRSLMNPVAIIGIALGVGLIAYALSLRGEDVVTGDSFTYVPVITTPATLRTRLMGLGGLILLVVMSAAFLALAIYQAGHVINQTLARFLGK